MSTELFYSPIETTEHIGTPGNINKTTPTPKQLFHNSVQPSSSSFHHSSISVPSIDVLFMSNSQLDELDRIQDDDKMDSCEIRRSDNELCVNNEEDVKYDGEKMEDGEINEKKVEQQNEEEMENEYQKEEDNENKTNDNHSTVRFIYPSGSLINRGFSITRPRCQPPIKRPRPPGLGTLISPKKAKVSSVLKKPIATSTPNRHGNHDITPVRPKILHGALIPNIIGTPRQPTGGYNPPRLVSEVSDKEENESKAWLLKQFAPKQTSTPAVDHVMKNGVTSPQYSPIVNQDIQCEQVISGFTTGSGKTMKLSKIAIEKAQELLSDEKNNDEVSSCHSNNCMSCDEEGKKSSIICHEDKLVPVDIDWEEFNTFTQLPKICKYDEEECDDIDKELLSTSEIDALFQIDSEDGKESSSDTTTSMSYPHGFTSKRIEHEITTSHDNDKVLSTVSCDSHVSKSTPGGKKITSSIPALETAKALVSEPVSPEDLCIPSCGIRDENMTSLFTTGSGKPVKISESSLKAAKIVLSEEPSRNSSRSVGFTTGSGKPVEISESSLKAAKMILSEEPSRNSSRNVGFTTGSGKPVEISESSLKAAKMVLSEEPSKNSSHNIGFTTGSGKPVEISESSLKAAKMVLSEEPSRNSSRNVGFTTGSGKPVEISESSLKAAKMVLSEEPSRNSSRNVGFTTGSGKPVEISESSLKAAKMVLSEEPSRNSSRNVGFTTGSGKPVEISKSSLKAAKMVLSEEPSRNSSRNVGFTTGSGNPVEISESSLKAAKMVLSEEPSRNSSRNVGFTTGSGKPVEISESSLKAAKMVLSEEPSRNSSRNVGFTTGSGKPVEISESSLKAAKMVLSEEPSRNSSRNVGFTTGSGKPVEISESSLKAAKMVLSEEPSRNSSRNVGFTTGSGKPVEISESSLKAAKMVLSEEPSRNSSRNVGFTTGSGKPVEISESSLKAAKMVLSEEPSRNSSRNVGFTTGSGKPVEISESSLKAAKMVLSEEPSRNSSRNVGFTTGSGKPVEISESSLKAAKMILSEEPSGNSSRNVGFTTGSGKPVEISESSLKAAKMVLSEESTLMEQLGDKEVLDKSFEGMIMFVVVEVYSLFRYLAFLNPQKNIVQNKNPLSEVIEVDCLVLMVCCIKYIYNIYFIILLLATLFDRNIQRKLSPKKALSVSATVTMATPAHLKYYNFIILLAGI